MFALNPTELIGFGPQAVSKTALFRLRGEGFALSVSGIDHIITTPRLFPLPLLDEFFSGVFVLQEEVVPFFNLYRFLGVEADDFSDSSPFAVLFMTEFGRVGLPADEVLRIVDDTDGSFERVGSDPNAIAEHCFLHAEVRYPLLSEKTMLARLTH